MSTQRELIPRRLSDIRMANESFDRIQLLQGTLDMLVLRTLLFGPAHGHQIVKHIQRTTDDLLQVEHGSLYPALHRLERRVDRGQVGAGGQRPEAGIQVLSPHNGWKEAARGGRVEVEEVDRRGCPDYVAG